MKTLRITKRLVITLMIAAVCLTVQSAQCLDTEDGIVNFTGRIMKIEGDVHVRRAGQITWSALEHGMELGLNDTIKTGVASNMDILFIRNKRERSKIRILEEAEMSLATLNLDKVTGNSEILLDLAIGHIIIKTDPLKGDSKFEVLTPTSMTAVRGTAFEVKVVRESPIADGDTIQ